MHRLQQDGLSERLKALRDEWKLRLRMALALREDTGHEPASAAELDRLVALQMAHWAQRPALDAAAARRFMRALNQRSISAFIFSVQDGRVALWPKPAIAFPADDEAAHRDAQKAFFKRAQLYRAFFEVTVRRHKLAQSFDFAFDVSDTPEDAEDLPIFSFQKLRGAHNPLLPDVDFFHCKWYRGDHDALAYEAKSVTACFVGSSTGDWLTEDTIRNSGTPRLHAAACFVGHPRVTFSIAKAVQCRTEQARQLLTQQPYFGSYVDWPDQLRHRFIISMDGNGAACSRLVKGLRSNSVVIKFDSPYLLYYFPALSPGCDHLVAQVEHDVERFIELEDAEPGRFKAVSEAGQRFAGKYLSIGSVMAYTARLLAATAARQAV